MKRNNEITLNTLIKKVDTVAEGLELIQNLSNHNVDDNMEKIKEKLARELTSSG
ncbi:hypothetical protein H6F32_19330 [Anabaena sp. FACHB-1237]|uniref:hypothetical protein n=1 Tax=Anabaena sp. FACHB-1237 TaxID=2692769 RepID=UPI001680AD6A|nr:hypothetical protein [Anabaena sp. FACHB-1237]MBD2139655.1 hypothetical protein [Anabaena sp. FACHB-1237]